MGYPGGKAGAGVFQTIINNMPPHRTYIEAFSGGGAILRRKKPAAASIAIDSDPVPLAELEGAIPNLTTLCADAVEWLGWHSRPWRGDELVYLDPPYLMETRSSKRAIYAHEFGEHTQHAQLLCVLLTLPCMVMISGYESSLYSEMLQDWRTVRFPAVKRSGKVAKEVIYMNYPEPTALHDYRYLGVNFRERERIGRQQARWRKRLAGMGTLQMRALLSVLEEVRNPGGIAEDDEERRILSP